MVVCKIDKSKDMSRINRGIIDTRDIFFACEIFFAFIIHPIHEEMYKGVGGALGVRKRRYIIRFVLKIDRTP